MRIILFLCSIFLSANLLAAEAVFAMGCFWSAEAAYRSGTTHLPLNGIKSLTVGYAGGTAAEPTYQNHPGYKEALRIVFDPKIISYEKLLEIFWHNIDMYDNGGQFCDRGPSYVAAIYYMDRSQQVAAGMSKEHLEKEFHKKIPIEILPYTTFYVAEPYHQDYKYKNLVSYDLYRFACGKDARLTEIWHR